MLGTIAAAAAATADQVDPWSGLAGQGFVTTLILGTYKLFDLILVKYVGPRRTRNAEARQQEADAKRQETANELEGIKALEKVPQVLFATLIEPLRREVTTLRAQIQELQQLIHDHEPWDTERVNEALANGHDVPVPPPLRLPPIPKPRTPGQ